MLAHSSADAGLNSAVSIHTKRKNAASAMRLPAFSNFASPWTSRAPRK